MFILRSKEMSSKSKKHKLNMEAGSGQACSLDRIRIKDSVQKHTGMPNSNSKLIRNPANEG